VSQGDRIPIPTNGHHGALTDAPETTGGPAVADDTPERAPTPLVQVTPGQLAVGFGILVGLGLLLLGRRRGRGGGGG
jgi:hypothetical protein